MVCEIGILEVLTVDKCNIPDTTGYAISQVHHKLRHDPSKAPVEVPSGPIRTPAVHCLRHVDTGFVEAISAGSSDLQSLIENKVSAGKLLCCDEHYTTLNLVSYCTSRNIPFLGHISPCRLTSVPDMKKPSTFTKRPFFRMFSGEFYLWICWDHHGTVLLVSNFHMGPISDCSDCRILKLYNKSIYGSERFDGLKNISNFDKNHPMCGDSDTLLYVVLNAITLNTKIIYRNEHYSPTLFIHLVKILLSYR